ncbi:MAG: 30S ribosomal protein S3 [Minisyncoccia bacterium]
MSRKTNIKILKIKKMEDWKSRGFYEKKFPNFLKEDLFLREYLTKKFLNAGIEAIEIERSLNTIKIIIKTSRPGFIIGKGGKGVEFLEKEIREKLKKINNNQLDKVIKIEIVEVKNPWTSAQIVAQWIALQLEKRIPYRRAMKMALAKILLNKEVKGAKILVSGRLNGVTIARSEHIEAGRLPRQNYRSDIDYGFAQAYCTYGVIGVKVWIYKGEKFD